TFCSTTWSSRSVGMRLPGSFIASKQLDILRLTWRRHEPGASAWQAISVRPCRLETGSRCAPGSPGLIPRQRSGLRNGTVVSQSFPRRLFDLQAATWGRLGTQSLDLRCGWEGPSTSMSLHSLDTQRGANYWRRLEAEARIVALTMNHPDRRRL